MSEWIAVEDQLPPKLVRVLGYWLDGRMLVGWWNGGPFITAEVGDLGYQPVYWQFLPAAPNV